MHRVWSELSRHWERLIDRLVLGCLNGIENPRLTSADHCSDSHAHYRPKQVHTSTHVHILRIWLCQYCPRATLLTSYWSDVYFQTKLWFDPHSSDLFNSILLHLYVFEISFSPLLAMVALPLLFCTCTLFIPAFSFLRSKKNNNPLFPLSPPALWAG